MAEVIRNTEVILNSIRYPLTGMIQPRLLSQQPQRFVTGSFEKANNPIVDSIVVDDLSHGILHMEDHGDPNACWFATADLRFKNEMTLPPLASTIDVPNQSYLCETTNDPGSDWTDDGNAINDNRADYAESIVPTGVTDEYLELIPDEPLTVYGFDYKIYGINSFTSVGSIHIDVYYEEDWHSLLTLSPVTTGGVTWEQIYRFSDPTAFQNVEKIRVYGKSNDAGNITVRVYDLKIVTDGGTISSFVGENYNSTLFVGCNAYLSYLHSGGTYFKLHQGELITGNILDLESSIDNSIYLATGDGNNYWWATGSQVPTETDVAGFTLLIHWDSKLWGMGLNGQLYYSAEPDLASPTWTSDALLDFDVGTKQKLLVYRDVQGNPIIYVVTSASTWSHDNSNTVFLETEVQIPEYTNVGVRPTVWQSKLYVPSGTAMVEYLAGGDTAINTHVGLDQWDGLPDGYKGEIGGLVPDLDTMYVLVDSSQVSGTGYSMVLRYNNGYYLPWLVDSNADKETFGGIVSSGGSSYRGYYCIGDNVYYTDLERGSTRPKQNSSYTYAADGFIITSWYTGKWEGGWSRALALKVEADDIDEGNEEIVVKYRTDHTNTDISTGWTTLGTISSDGLTTYKFPNNSAPAGTEFRSIQFRFDLSRGSTTTKSPILRYFVFEFQKVIPTAWGWAFTVDCTKSHDGKTPEQLLDAMVSAVETHTLVSFVYDDATEYVEIVSVEGARLTGEGRTGTYNVLVRAPQ